MDQICIHCNAKFWIDERDQKSSQASSSFAVCCAGSKVSLPPLLKPPSYILDLYTSSSSDAALFRKNIRGYNNILACTSFGANIDERFQGQGVSNFRIHGQLYVALSRVISYQCIKVLILQNDYQKDCQTKNIVYKEIFQNT